MRAAAVVAVGGPPHLTVDSAPTQPRAPSPVAMGEWVTRYRASPTAFPETSRVRRGGELPHLVIRSCRGGSAKSELPR